MLNQDPSLTTMTHVQKCTSSGVIFDKKYNCLIWLTGVIVSMVKYRYCKLPIFGKLNFPGSQKHQFKTALMLTKIMNACLFVSMTILI